ncbi:MAG: tetratricopeptide repeat protein [Desulfurivibrionaceae bacterium]
MQDTKLYSLFLNARWIYLILLVILIAVSYSNTLHSPFLLDDYHTFIEDPGVKIREVSLSSLEKLRDTKFGRSRLVPIITLALDNSLGGGNVFQFHLTNIAIHLLCSIAVFFLISGLLATRAGASSLQYLSAVGFSLIATGLWALNPVQTNAITYLVQRMTSIAALFYISALAFYIHGRLTAVPWNRYVFFTSATVAALLAFLSKENAFTLPAALLLIEFYFLSPGTLGRVLKKTNKKQWFLLSLGCLILLPLLADLLQNAVAGYGSRDFTLTERMLTQLRVVVFYISLLLLPLPGRLNLEHDFPLSISLISPPATLLCFIMLSAIFLIAIKTRKSHPLISFGIMWFFLNLLIESTFVPLEIIFEHRLYLPSVGFFIVIATLLDLAARLILSRYPGQSVKRLLFFIIVILFCFSSFLTYSRNNDWRDPLTFYSDIVKKSPNKERPRNDLAMAYAERGDFDNAIKHNLIAIEINPEYAAAYNNLGNLYRRMGMLDKADNYLRQALRLKPGMAGAYNNLGLVYSQKGMTAKAMEAYRRALELNPGDSGVYNNLGEAYEKAGQLDGAVRIYREALRINPDNAEAHNHLGIALAKKGLVDEAIRHFQLALRIKPDEPYFHSNIANAYTMKGMARKADEHRRRAENLRGGR